MLFTEATFLLLFLPILLALYFLTIAAETRTRGRAPARVGAANWLLLLASLVFYAKGGGGFTWLMLASIAFNYWMAIAIDRAREPSSSNALGARHDHFAGAPPPALELRAAARSPRGDQRPQPLSTANARDSRELTRRIDAGSSS